MALPGSFRAVLASLTRRTEAFGFPLSGTDGICPHISRLQSHFYASSSNSCAVSSQQPWGKDCSNPSEVASDIDLSHNPSPPHPYGHHQPSTRGPSGHFEGDGGQHVRGSRLVPDGPGFQDFLRMRHGSGEGAGGSRAPHSGNSGETGRRVYVETYGCQMNEADSQVGPKYSTLGMNAVFFNEMPLKSSTKKC